jgi:hypothetical protein
MRKKGKAKKEMEMELGFLLRGPSGIGQTANY